jgi:hypothetical protein
MDRISTAIEERFGYICCWDFHKVNGLAINGSVGVERYLSYSSIIQLSDLNLLESIEGRVTNNNALPLRPPGGKWHNWRWWNIRLVFSLCPSK